MSDTTPDFKAIVMRWWERDAEPQPETLISELNYVWTVERPVPASVEVEGLQDGERLCHQCGTLHIIPWGAECLKRPDGVGQEALTIAMKAGITKEWVLENLIPIRRILKSLAAAAPQSGEGKKGE